MNRTVRYHLIVDTLIWLSVWMVYTAQPHMVFASTFLVFFCWLSGIVNICAAISPTNEVDNVLIELIKQEPKHYGRYALYSTIVEAVAIAAIGFWFSGIIYLCGGVALCGRREKLKAKIKKVEAI